MMRIQTKVTLLFIALTSMVILLLSGFIFGFSYYYAFEDFYERLETRVRIAHSIYSDQDKQNSAAVKALRQQYLEKLPSEKEYILLLTADGQVTDRHQAVFSNKLLSDILDKGEARYRDGNKFYAGKRYLSPAPGFIVIVSATDPYGLEEIGHLRKILAVGFVISLLAIYLVGKIFSYQTFKPIREMTRRVQSITAENLHLRLEMGTGKDEIDTLGQTFNDMLSRLETAFETQNNFVSNASHELRTPLTIIKGEAELTLRSPELSETNQYSVQAILREAEKLNQILTGLLTLAQSGFDGKKQHWETIRVDELIWMAKEVVDQVYPQNNIRFDFNELPADESQLQVLGNSNLLKLAVSNIVANACKYSHNQLVVIGLASKNGQVAIRIKDEGIGIPETELRHIFEPFFRASNTSDFEGYGVGLPLALNIIRLHKGSIAITTKEGLGTEMQVLLPVAPVPLPSQQESTAASPPHSIR
jgi:signal transduction histidine kinase